MSVCSATKPKLFALNLVGQQLVFCFLIAAEGIIISISIEFLALVILTLYKTEW